MSGISGEPAAPRLGPFQGPLVARGLQARVLGMIYEDLLVPCLEDEGWEVIAGKRASYDSGVLRPVVYVKGKTRGLTFDYILRRDGHTYLAEAKSWPVFEGKTPKTAERNYIYRYVPSLFSFRLNDDPCYIGGKSTLGQPIHLDGKALLWWKVTQQEVEEWAREGVVVLSIESLLKSGQRLGDFQEMVRQYRRWIEELFDSLEEGWD